jgi:hypothetical protein
MCQNLAQKVENVHASKDKVVHACIAEGLFEIARTTGQIELRGPGGFQCLGRLCPIAALEPIR